MAQTNAQMNKNLKEKEKRLSRPQFTGMVAQLLSQRGVK
jgi:hypothetical protein